MPDFFGNLIDQILGFARAHEQWLPAIGFAFAFVKSLPLVALFVPGTALLLSIGAVLGSGAGQFAPVWLAIAIGAALGDWVAYALGVKVGPALLQWAPLRRRPRQVPRGGFHQALGRAEHRAVPLLRALARHGADAGRHFRDAARAVPGGQLGLGFPVGGGAAGAGLGGRGLVHGPLAPGQASGQASGPPGIQRGSASRNLAMA